MRTPSRSRFLWLILAAGCGGGTGGNDSKYTFPAQGFNEDFDAGQAASRWGCPQGGCAWDVVEAGHLAPVTEVAGTTPGRVNYVFQSPDPQALDLNPSMTCVDFPTRFGQPGTFAFNYLYNTAGPIFGGQDGNYLEVTLTTYTVADDPEFGEVILDSRDSLVLKVTGQGSSRFQMAVEPGYYGFRFCYLRNRTFQIGPDFVQLDEVDTCAGTGCLGDVPVEARCRPDQGAILVPDFSALPTHVISVLRVQGMPGRYHVIINADLLEFVSASLVAAPTEYDGLKVAVDSLLTVTYVHGTTCELDRRRSVLIEMTQLEIIDFVLLNATVADMLDAVIAAAEENFINDLREWLVGEIIESIYEEITEALFRIVL